jgi:predicted heme/steroid binding protein
MKVLSNLSLYGTLGLNSVVDANTDTDKFLVIDSNGIVKYRTGQELYNDIGAGGAASYTSTLQHEVKAGVALTKGQAVYVTSADGTNMIVSKASNASEATSSKTLGLIAQDLNINGKGYVITEGLLSGLNTMAAGTEGDPVWLGTDGNLIYGLGSKPYAPAHLVFIGIVTRRNANNGEIFVKVQNGFELQELHNVQITSTPSDNTVLAYETSTSLYKMKSIPTLLGYTPTTNARTLTINGTSYDLSADRSWSVGTHTGNLTTGYVPKATGATTLTDSLIYDNGSGIGINTASPYDSANFKLDVNGGVIIKNTSGTLAQLILINSNPATGGNNGFVQFTAGGNTATAFAELQSYYGLSVASGALRLQPAGGQVLIGTRTASAFTTDINGTLRVSGQLTLGSTISSNTYVYTMPGASGTLALVSQIPSLSGYVQTSRTLTINGVSYDLSADRSWSITAGVSSVQAGSGISVSTSGGVATVSNTGLLSGTAGSGISVSTSGQNLNIVNTGLLSGTAGSGISVSTSGQNLNIVNTGLLSATAGSGISVSTSSQNVNIVNTGLLSATAGTGISVSTSSGVLTITNTITNTNQLTNGAGYITGITGSMVTTALGYTPVTSDRTLTINGTSYDLSSNRSWSVGTVVGNSNVLSDANGTNVTINGGYFTGFNPSNIPSGQSSGDWGLMTFPLWTGNGSGERYSVQLAANLDQNDNIYIRKFFNFTSPYRTAWHVLLNSANISSYAVTSLTDTLATVTARGASTSSAITINGIDSALKVQHDGTSVAWRGRIGSFNASADKSSFLGNYTGRAGVFGHNNALSAWDELWVNTLGIYGQGNLYLSWFSYVKANGGDTNYAVLHAGNYNSYSPTLTGGGASGTWGISITGNAATSTNASQLNGLSKVQLWNNSGATHSSYLSFGAIPNFGVWFMQNPSASDSPQSASQYYVQTQGLGVEYGYGTTPGNYALMTAVAREHTRKYTYYRTLENGAWGSWTKGAAGYADEAAVLSSMNISQFTNNSGYITGYTETDTLATVTSRGNTTSNAITVNDFTVTTGYIRSNNHIYNLTTGGSAQNVWMKRALISESYYGTDGLIPWGSGLNKTSLWVHDYGSGVKHGAVISADNDGEAHIYAVDFANSSGSSTIGSSAGGWGWNMYYDGVSSDPFNLRIGLSGTWTHVLKISFARDIQWQNINSFTINGNQVWHQGNLTNLNQLSNGPGYITQSTGDGRYLIGTTNPGSVGNFTLSIGNNGSYSYVQSHSSQPLELNPVGNTVRIAGNVVWHAGNLTNLNQLTNGPGYLTSLPSHNHDGVYMKTNRTLDTINTIDNGGDRYNPSVNNPTNEHYAVLTYGNGGNVTGQLATHFVTGQLYSRGYNSAWSSWLKYVVENGGTWGINITGGAGSANLASNSNLLNGMSVTQIFNNMGQSHGTRTSFDASTPSYDFGFRYVQGLGNGPGTGGGIPGQFYSLYIGLGNDYPATGGGSYGMYLAIDRNSDAPYLSVRYNENNSLSSWRKIRSGYADVTPLVNAPTFNQPAVRVNSSGTGSAGSSIAIQQITAEGWTGVFVDFEPNTGWGLYHDNPNNYFCVTSEATTGSLRSFTVPSRESGNRTAHEKIRFDQNNGSILAGGDITAFSDGRIKTNVEVVGNPIEKIKQIRGVTFLKTNSEGEDKNKRHAGVIAQEVLKVLPEVVNQDKDTGMYNVAYGNLAALFIEAIKEQQKQIEDLKSELNALTK